MNRVLNLTPRITGTATSHDPCIAEYMNGDGMDWLLDMELELLVETQKTAEALPDKYLIFFWVGTEEYQQTVEAYSVDHALEVFCRDNKNGEDPEAVRLDDEERNY